MRAVTVRYKFSQRFRVPAKEAFRWAIDFRADDFSRMGIGGSRRVQPISSGTLLLTDTSYGSGKPVRKTKLINIHPGLLSYSNTHIGGPFKHSQFIYQFVPLGKKASRLDFTGHLVIFAEKPPTVRAIARMADEERRADSEVWKHLASAMENDLVRKSR